MNLLYPAFLFALSAIAIPIIVHLFNFRRFKKVLFPQVRFLREIKEETTSRSKLKHLLVLAARILSIIFLVLAFAQPYIPEKGTKIQQGETAVSVFIDNSFSMEAANGEGNLLDEAKRKAKELVAAYGPNDRFQLLTNDFEGKEQRLLTREEFLEALPELRISPNHRTLSAIIARQKEVFYQQQEKNRVLYLLSDFQKSTVDEQALQADSAYTIRLVPISTLAVANVSIDSLSFTSPIHRPGEPEQLIVFLHNSGQKEAERVPIKLLVNKEQKAIGSISLQAGESGSDTLNFVSDKSGLQQAELRITDQPITFDNTYYAAWQVAEKMPILRIYGEKATDFIPLVYKSDPFFALNSVAVDRVDYASIPAASLLILDELKVVSSGLALELKKYLQKGGHLFIIPSREMDMASMNSFLQDLSIPAYGAIVRKENKVSLVTVQEGLFKDVFSTAPSGSNLPQLKEYYSLQNSSRSARQNILTLATQEPLLSKFPIGKGYCYLSAVALQPECSNLSKHALFLPMLYRMALLSTQASPLAFTVGQHEALPAPASLLIGDDHPLRLKKDSLEIIPDVQGRNNTISLFVSDQLKEEGMYTLLSGKQAVSTYAFNYTRKESNLSYYSPEELKDLLSTKGIYVLEESKRSLKDSIAEANYGLRLWKLCLILTLLFLAAEILLLRFWDRLMPVK